MGMNSLGNNFPSLVYPSNSHLPTHQPTNYAHDAEIAAAVRMVLPIMDLLSLLPAQGYERCPSDLIPYAHQPVQAGEGSD